MSALNLPQLAFLLVIFVVVAGTAVATARLLRPDQARRRLRKLMAGGPDTPAEAAWVGRVAHVLRPLSSMAAPEDDESQSALRLRLTQAGLRHPAAPAAFFGIKAVLTLGLPALVFAFMAVGGVMHSLNTSLMVLLLAASLGYYSPNVVVSQLLARRQREIFEHFPDALDLMTICMEAGLGTEAAMVRVASDLQSQSPILAEEMRVVNLEVRAGADRARALRNLAARTGVDEVEGFVTMINQAERFGTSVATSLRIQSDLLRTKRRQRAEESAAKVAVKLLFPLMFCLFPALLVVLMAPALIQAVTLWKSMSGG